MIFLKIVNEFRNLYMNKILISNFFMFAIWQSKFTDLFKKNTDEDEEDKEQREFNSDTMSCICDSKHWFEDCLYMMKVKRSREWKFNEKMIENFWKRMIKSIEIWRRIEKLQENEKNSLNLSENFWKNLNSLEDQKTAITLFILSLMISSFSFSISSLFILTLNTTLTSAFLKFSMSIQEFVNSVKFVYSLLNSFILNNEATIHICNSFSYFTSFTNSQFNHEQMLTDSSLVSIEDYSMINLHLNSDEDKIEKLQKIYYISIIKTNIIFIQKLNRKEFIFHVELRQHVNIKKNKKMFIYTDYMKKQYVIKYNSSIMFEFFHLNDSAVFTNAVLSSSSELLFS